MSPVEQLLERLECVKQTPRGWIARCPAHRDRSPSLSIAEGSDNRILLKCWAGCSAPDVVQALGLTMADLFERNDYQPSPRRKLIRPNWREIIQILYDDASMILVIAEAMASKQEISEMERDLLIMAHQSLSNVVRVTGALAGARA